MAVWQTRQGPNRWRSGCSRRWCPGPRRPTTSPSAPPSPRSSWRPSSSRRWSSRRSPASARPGRRRAPRPAPPRSPPSPLPPKGMHAVGLAESSPDAGAAAGGPVGPSAEPAPELLELSEPPAAVPTERPGELAPASHDSVETRVVTVPDARKVTWRHVLYAVVYVVLGLVFLLVLHSVIGLLVVAAGLALGAFALRPLWRTAR